MVYAVSQDGYLYESVFADGAPWSRVYPTLPVLSIAILSNGGVLAVEAEDHLLYTKQDDSSPWVQIGGTGPIYGVTIMPDQSLVGTDLNGNSWTAPPLATPSFTWSPLPNSSGTLSITALADGTLLGVRSDNKLYHREGIKSPWTLANAPGRFLSVSAAPDGSLLLTGTNGYLYTMSQPIHAGSWTTIAGSSGTLAAAALADGTFLGINAATNTLMTGSDLYSPWTQLSGCCYINLAQKSDGTLLNVGTDRTLYTLSNATQDPTQIQYSGSVYSAKPLDDGPYLGVGTDHQLWTLLSPGSPQSWLPLGSSVPLLHTAQLQSGAIVAVGSNNYLYLRTIWNTWIKIGYSGTKSVAVMQDGTIFGVDTTGSLSTLNRYYSFVSVPPSFGGWTQAPVFAPPVKWIDAIADGSFVGIGTDHLLYTRQDLTHPWVQIPNSGATISIAQLQDGTFLAVGTDHQLWTKTSLMDPWQQAAQTAVSLLSVIQVAGGSFVGIGTDNLLYTRQNLTQPWVQIPNSGGTVSIIQLQDGTFLAAGTDNLLYSKASLSGPWTQLPNSGAVIGISLTPNGSIVAVGTDQNLYTASLQ